MPLSMTLASTSRRRSSPTLLLPPSLLLHGAIGISFISRQPRKRAFVVLKLLPAALQIHPYTAAPRFQSSLRRCRYLDIAIRGLSRGIEDG